MTLDGKAVGMSSRDFRRYVGDDASWLCRLAIAPPHHYAASRIIASRKHDRRLHAVLTGESLLLHICLEHFCIAGCNCAAIISYYTARFTALQGI